ncbi:MAG: hypothetical protein GY795_50560 [Desulfobacterales bacterium]|nr:hypothetical protein [Desulfobacterales bacterium]
MEIIESKNLSELTQKISLLNIPPETSLRVTVEEIRKKHAHAEKNSSYLFLNDDVWDGKNTPDDLAENHDNYLYC